MRHLRLLTLLPIAGSLACGETAPSGPDTSDDPETEEDIDLSTLPDIAGTWIVNAENTGSITLSDIALGTTIGTVSSATCKITGWNITFTQDGANVNAEITGRRLDCNGEDTDPSTVETGNFFLNEVFPAFSTTGKFNSAGELDITPHNFCLDSPWNAEQVSSCSFNESLELEFTAPDRGSGTLTLTLDYTFTQSRKQYRIIRGSVNVFR